MQYIQHHFIRSIYLACLLPAQTHDGDGQAQFILGAKQQKDDKRFKHKIQLVFARLVLLNRTFLTQAC